MGSVLFVVVLFPIVNVSVIAMEQRAKHTVFDNQQIGMILLQYMV